MKNKILFGACVCFLLVGFTSERNDAYPPVKNESFRKGETLHFKMTYGIFTVGRGTARIDEQYHNVYNRQCFKVDIEANTVGMVDWVADVHDKFGAYIDTASILPQMFYRKIREGNYRKDEQTYFDQEKKVISVRTLDKETGNWKEPVTYEAPPHVRELVAGFLWLRVMDISRIKVNDTIRVGGFFEDQFYNLRIVYKGKATVKTKIDNKVVKIRTLVFKPVMPKNKLFEGEEAITAYFSDDKNRTIIKIDAEMFIGSAGVELTGYSGLRNPLNIVKH